MGGGKVSLLARRKQLHCCHSVNPLNGKDFLLYNLSLTKTCWSQDPAVSYISGLPCIMPEGALG